MDLLAVVLVLLFPFLWAILHTLISNKFSRSSKLLPPGPSPLPIVGNILGLGDNPHQSLANLSKRYGPVMTLKFGSKTTIVISSFEMAKEVLNTNDVAFSSRTVPYAACSFNHDTVSMDLFAAGTETTSSTVEWAMAELLHNPHKMAKAKQELQQVLGKNCKFEETRISKLSYLNAVVKETLRLHPPVPFLLPRKSESEEHVGGFLVPKNSQILVNVWAIGRDSRVWKEPNSFEPERFMEGHDHHEIDFKGRDFEFIPFGAGRRICPGLPLANRVVHLMLVTLLNNFDWVLENGLKSEEMDMSDHSGVTLKKDQPLRAVPTNLVR